MAEKEQRILIKKQINYHPPYGGWRGEGKEIVLTRQEAIEKIEKAVFALAGGISNLKTKEYNATKCTAHWIAEAVLNAVLGDK